MDDENKLTNNLPAKSERSRTAFSPSADNTATDMEEKSFCDPVKKVSAFLESIAIDGSVSENKG